MNTVITYYITKDGKEWQEDTDIEWATIIADAIKGQVFTYHPEATDINQQLILVYSHGERQLRLS